MNQRDGTPDRPLDTSISWRLAIDEPFNFGMTVRLLQRRPGNPIDRWEDERYWRALQTPAGMRLVGLRNAGSIEMPELRLELFGGPISSEARAVVDAAMRWALGLDTPPAPTGWLAALEPRFAPVATVLRGFRAPAFLDLWQACLAVIPFQQLSLDAGIAILRRLVERFSTPFVNNDRAWFDFPAPEAIANAPLPALGETGLSHAKAAALQALARHALAGDLDRARFMTLPSPAALTALQALPGIGPWSAAVLLLRGLRRLDVFPPGDTGAARSLTALLGSPTLLTPVGLREFTDRFGDRRGYLYFLFLGNRLMADVTAPA